MLVVSAFEPVFWGVVILSPALGSFAAVLADRLPRGEDVVTARSRCRACKTALSARDLIPLLSYLLLHGRCRQCGAPIPRWLWLLEGGALGLTIILGMLWAPYAGLPQAPPMLALDAALLWLMLALIADDLRFMRLPNLLTALLFGGALARALIWAGAEYGTALPLAVAPQAALFGAGLGVISFATLRFGYHILRKREGLGMGDVKLMAGIGALVGPIDLPLLVLMAAGGMLLWAVLCGQARRATTPLPFGAALTMAALGLMAARLASGCGPILTCPLPL